MESNSHPQTQSVAERVGETGSDPLSQISRALFLLGVEPVEAAVAEAIRIEANGGLTTANGQGHHTLGGLFFLHLRKTVDKTQWRTIRYGDGTGDDTQPTVVALEWAERAEAVMAAREGRGVITDVSLTAIGRPLASKPQGDNYMVLALESNGTLPPISPELPKPPSVSTTFKVVVGSMQWKKLQGPIRDSDSDLVAYGYPIPNIKQKAVVAFALTAGVQARPEDEDVPPAVSRVKLILKPGQVIQRGATLVLAADSNQPPKKVLAQYSDLPVRAVAFTVYISQKQWHKVVGETDLKDRSLGLNGVCFYDPEVESLAVLAQNLHLV